MEVTNLLKENITGVIGDTSCGKSSLLCNIIEEVQSISPVDIWTYGIHEDLSTLLNTKPLYSIDVMATIKNSIIIVDEMGMFFDLDNRKFKPIVEEVLRLVNHNNNKLILCGLAYDFKKFLSARVKTFIYGYVTIGELINGGLTKRNIFM